MQSLNEVQKNPQMPKMVNFGGNASLCNKCFGRSKKLIPNVCENIVHVYTYATTLVFWRTVHPTLWWGGLFAI
jgi:hypothetical protein